MKSKHVSQSAVESDNHAYRRAWPLVIRDGQVDDSLIQTIHFISGMFKHFEHEGKVPVQASIGLNVIFKDE